MVDLRDDGHVPDVMLVVHARAELVDGDLNHLGRRRREMTPKMSKAKSGFTPARRACEIQRRLAEWVHQEELRRCFIFLGEIKTAQTNRGIDIER